MYAPFFGLGREPFSIAPDPRFLFMSERHREALAHLLFGVGGGGGFVLLTGEVGAGKTTVARCFLEQLPAHCGVAYIFNPKLTAIELLQTVCAEFGIAVAGDAASVKAHVDALNAFLLQGHAQGRQALLVIDEAQSLEPEVLEQLRLLTNLETNERKLLQIVLLGQPELRTMLAQPGLTQLAQRVIARYHLGPLTCSETRQYAAHRWAVAAQGAAGAATLPLDERVLDRVHRLSGGVPRRVNLLLGRALLGAYARGVRRVDARMVEQAAREVFDDAAAQRAAGAGRRGVAALLAWSALAAAAALGAWAWQRTEGGGPATAPAGAVAASAPQAAAAMAQSGVADAASAASADAAPGASPPASAPVAVVAAVEDVVSVPAWTPSELLAAAHRDEGTAWRELALRWGVAIGEGDACQVVLRAQLACYRSSAGGLALMRQLGRPGWVTLAGDDGARRYALLVGLGSDHAELQVGAQRMRLALPHLARVWKGDFATLWRTPPLWPGASADAVNVAPHWLGRALGSVAPEQAALPLREQVLVFQRVQGLPGQGVAGPLTLMVLGRLAGNDEPRLERSTEPEKP